MPLASVQGFAGGVRPALLGLVLGLAVFLPFWVVRLMGAGDVKFLAVLSFWFGLEGLLVCWLVGSVIALVHALVEKTMAWRRKRKGSPKASSKEVNGKGVLKGAPYAAYLSIGAAVWLFAVRG